MEAKDEECMSNGTNLPNGEAVRCDLTTKSSEEENEENFDDLPKLEDVDEKLAVNGDQKEEEKRSDCDENGFFDIFDNKNLLKKVLKEGEKNGQRPQRGCRVTISVVTRLKDSEQLIESQSFDSLRIIIGDYDTIHGIDLIIPLMDLKEKAQVIIAPRFAYGSKGCEPDVPPDSTLDCIVELLDCEWMDEELELPIEERLSIGCAKKERGNFWFSREEYSISGQCYNRALKFLDVNEDEAKLQEGNSSDNPLVKQLIELRTATFNNLAAVHMKTETFDAALKAVNNALMLNERNVKALFRKGKILGILSELDEAVDVLRSAAKLESDNKAIQVELSKMIVKRREQLMNEKKMYKRMLQLDKVSPKSSKLNLILKCGVVASAMVAVGAGVAYHYGQ